MNNETLELIIRLGECLNLNTRPLTKSDFIIKPKNKKIDTILNEYINRYNNVLYVCLDFLEQHIGNVVSLDYNPMVDFTQDNLKYLKITMENCNRLPSLQRYIKCLEIGYTPSREEVFCSFFAKDQINNKIQSRENLFDLLLENLGAKSNNEFLEVRECVNTSYYTCFYEIHNVTAHLYNTYLNLNFSMGKNELWDCEALNDLVESTMSTLRYDFR